jgi:hypothetical protein
MGRDRFTDGLRGIPRMFMQELRGKVRTVGPDYSMTFRINLELRKDLRILEWLENWAIELIGEVYLSLRSIVKPDP